MSKLAKVVDAGALVNYDPQKGVKRIAVLEMAETASRVRTHL